MNKAIDFPAGAGDFSPMYSAAINYVQNGWKITQLSEHGKIPLISDWRSRPVETIEQVETVWGSHPKFNIGLLCANNGLVCVDIDLRKEHEPEDVLDGFQELAILEEHYGFKCESSVIQNSGSGGRHYFFKAPEGISFAGAVINPLTGKKCNKIDIRFNHQIVVEPSIHPSGGRYEWVNGGIIANEPSELPSQLLALIRKDREQPKDPQQQSIGHPNKDTEQITDDFCPEFWGDSYDLAISGVVGTPEGSRNDTLYEKAVHIFSLVNEKRVKVTLDQAKAELTNAGFKCGLESDEIKRILESALRSSTVTQACPEKHQKALEEWKKRKTLERGIHWVDLTEKGRPLETIENLKALLNFHGITCRYNVIKKEQQILIPTKSFFADTKANDTLSEIISISKRERFGTTNTQKYLSAISSENLYNPVLVWIKSKEWDGQSRIEQFLKTVSVDEPKILSTGEQFHEHLIRKWMIQAVSAATAKDGLAAVGILVFQGTQGLGKTSWFKKLVPCDLQKEFLKTGSFLNPRDYDSLMQNISYWLVELGELDGTLKKSEIADLKAHITNDTDEIRKKYAAESNTYGRRTVYFASVNSENFLTDETGNRRFWTVPTSKIDFQHNFDMQQIWAEVLFLKNKGENFLLSPEAEKILSDNNESHMTLEPIADRIETRINWNCLDKSKWQEITPTDLYQNLMEKLPTARESSKLKAFLAMRGIEQIRTKKSRYFLVPPFIWESDDL